MDLYRHGGSTLRKTDDPLSPFGSPGSDRGAVPLRRNIFSDGNVVAGGPVAPPAEAAPGRPVAPAPPPAAAPAPVAISGGFDDLIDWGDVLPPPPMVKPTAVGPIHSWTPADGTIIATSRKGLMGRKWRRIARRLKPILVVLVLLVAAAAGFLVLYKHAYHKAPASHLLGTRPAAAARHRPTAGHHLTTATSHKPAAHHAATSAKTHHKG